MDGKELSTQNAGAEFKDITWKATNCEYHSKSYYCQPEYSLEQIELVCKDKDAWG